MVVKPSFNLLYTYFGKLFYRTASFSVARFHLTDYISTLSCHQYRLISYLHCDWRISEMHFWGIKGLFFTTYLTLLHVVMADKYKGLAFCTTIYKGYQSQLN
jgi:hypothetical protein